MRPGISLALKSYRQAHALFVKLGILRSQAIALLGLGTVYEKARDFTRRAGATRSAAARSIAGKVSIFH